MSEVARKIQKYSCFYGEMYSERILTVIKALSKSNERMRKRTVPHLFKINLPLECTRIQEDVISVVMLKYGISRS